MTLTPNCRYTTGLAALLAMVVWFGVVKAGDDGLDLPVEKPEKAAPVVPKKASVGHPIMPPPPPITDPAPLPHAVPSFYGKDLAAQGSIVFVIDVSWSMETADAGGGDTRIKVAKRELTKAIHSLPNDFKFDAICYNCAVEPWSDGLVVANEANKSSASAWVDSLMATGATGTGPAVAFSLHLTPECRYYVLLTDGAPNCGAGDELGDWSCMQAHESQIHWANDRKARIDVFGIHATGEMKQFCLDVARDSVGTYTDAK